MITDLGGSKIKDKKAHEEYLKLLEHPMFGPNRYLQTSNEDIIIDPHMARDSIQLKIKRLPKDERDRIMKKLAVFTLNWNKLQKLRVKALGKGKTKNTLTKVFEERKVELIAQFGALRSYEEIIKLIKYDWGYNVTARTLQRFKIKHKDAIDRETINFHKDHSHLRLSHKRGRLEELEYIYKKRKAVYDNNPSIANERQLLTITDQIRKEMDEKRMQLDIDITANIQKSINVRLREDVMGNMSVNDIIIARAAHKMGVNPRFILSRLHNSLYATVAGAKAPHGQLEQEEIIYPSQYVYDFTKIKKQHHEKGDVGLELAEYEEIPEESKPSISNLKQLMKENLAKKKERLDEMDQKLRDSQK